jgi:hypothetical protein
MSQELTLLTATAASIGLVHTLLGPDHYLPFVVMARARRWPLGKTLAVTAGCGLGHVLSSVVLGLLGVALGAAVGRLELIEDMRGNLAAWALMAFGFVYFVWGVRRSLRERPHRHVHAHGDGTWHTHTHSHTGEHVHVHDERRSLTPWMLFVIFVLGPCEPLIPLLMYPAARMGFWQLVWIAAVFGVVTIVTMTSVVLIASAGLGLAPLARLERHVHALAGASICLCGAAIRFLGL